MYKGFYYCLRDEIIKYIILSNQFFILAVFSLVLPLWDIKQKDFVITCGRLHMTVNRQNLFLSTPFLSALKSKHLHFFGYLKRVSDI